MYRVSGSIEEFETYEKALTELQETTDSLDVAEFIDTSLPEVIDKFFICGNSDDFYVWFYEKIDDAFEQMKEMLIIEYDEEE